MPHITKFDGFSSRHALSASAQLLTEQHAGETGDFTPERLNNSELMVAPLIEFSRRTDPLVERPAGNAEGTFDHIGGISNELGSEPGELLTFDEEDGLLDTLYGRNHHDLNPINTELINEIIESTVHGGNYYDISNFNPSEYLQPGIDPMTQMELVMDQADAWAMESAGSHGHDGHADHMYDVETYSGAAETRYHKHNPDGTTTHTYVNENKITVEIWGEDGLISSIVEKLNNDDSDSDSESGDKKWWQFWKKDEGDNGITPESEGGGANITSVEPIAWHVVDQEMTEDFYSQSLIGESVYNNNIHVMSANYAESMTALSPQLYEMTNMAMASNFM